MRKDVIAERHEPLQRVAVVGSGAGGLTSAVLLAMHGYDVTVFERHYRPGGFLHRFFREAVAYDTGFHYCGGVGRDDIFGRALRHLRVFDDLHFHPMDLDGFDRLLFDDMEFRVPVGVEAYRARLKDTFPHEAAGIDIYVNALGESVSKYGLYSFSFDVDVDHFLKWESTGLGEFIDQHITDPKLKAVLCGQSTLYGVPPTEAPFGIHALVMDHFLRGAHRIKGGGDRLAMSLVRRLKALGGRLRLKSKVQRVEVGTGRSVSGVTLDSGEFFPADIVISNLHPRLTVDLLPKGAVRPAYRNRVRGTRVATAHFALYAKSDGPLDAIGNSNVYRQTSFDPNVQFESIAPGRVPFYFATAPGEGFPEGARRDDVLLMLSVLPWSAVERWAGSGERDPAYLDFKHRLQDTLVAALLDDFSQLQLSRVESSTALSTVRFTGSPEGAMYGHYHSVDQMGRYRPSQVTRVKNLIMVGHGVFAPGILGAMLSAYYACSYLIGQDRLLQEILET